MVSIDTNKQFKLSTPVFKDRKEEGNFFHNFRITSLQQIYPHDE